MGRCAHVYAPRFMLIGIIPRQHHLPRGAYHHAALPPRLPARDAPAQELIFHAGIVDDAGRIMRTKTAPSGAWQLAECVDRQLSCHLSQSYRAHGTGRNNDAYIGRNDRIAPQQILSIAFAIPQRVGMLSAT